MVTPSTVTLFTDSAGHPETYWEVYNPALGITFAANRNGHVIIAATTGALGMQVDSVKRTDTALPLQPVILSGSEKRLEIVHPGFTEWYVSSTNGIEQGMTIPAKPAGEGQLKISYALSGNLRPVIGKDGTIVFEDANGPVMRYGELHATDAAGRTLPTALKLTGTMLVWEIDDRHAVYPVIIDPSFTPTTRLVPTPIPAADDYFGHSVSIYNNTAVIGASQNNSGSGTYSGAAYIYQNSGGTWSQTQKIWASHSAAGDRFGTAVAIHNDIAVIGAYGNASGGAAYIFQNIGGTWTQSQKINASDAAGEFGRAVSVYNDTAVIGAQTTSGYTGAAYVFQNLSGTWTQTQKLLGSDSVGGDQFGYSVSIFNDTILVGAQSHNSGSGSSSGEAYIFKYNGTGWNETAKLVTNPSSASGDNFGFSVSLYNDTAVIGAYGNRTSSDTYEAGTAYVFHNSGGTWTQSQKIEATPASGYRDRFGFAVSIYNDTLVIGAYGYPDNAQRGAAYIFQNQSGTWTQTAILQGVVNGDMFGAAVSPYNGTAMIGAYRNDSGGGSYSGAVYLAGTTVMDPPTLTEISPTSGSNVGTILVTVTGTGFDTSLAPSLNFTRTGYSKILMTGKNLTSTSFTATVPADITTGTWNVSVVNPDGQVGDNTSVIFTATAAPLALTNIIPTSGGNATTTLVTVTGTGFNTTSAPLINLTRSGYSNVTMTGTNLSLRTFTVTVPANVIMGVWNVSVVNPDGEVVTNASVTFTSSASAPVLISISPATGANNTATFVTVNGSGFNATSAPRVNLTRSGYSNISVTGTNLSATSLTMTVPANVISGIWNVIVINPDGQQGANASVTFTSTVSPPMVTSISPSSGANISTTSVTITGTGFNTTVAPTVNLTKTGYSNITLTSVNVASSTSLTATVPSAGIAGTYTLVVINPDGQSGTKTDAFQVTNSTTPSPTPQGGSDSGSVSSQSSGSGGSGVSIADSAPAGSSVSYSFGSASTSYPVSIQSVTIVPDKAIGNSECIVTRDQPSEAFAVPDNPAAYQSIEIAWVNPNDIASGTITFSVMGTWLRENSIDPMNVVLMRQHDYVWYELPTAFDHQQGDLYYYTAVTPGFSSFAVSVNKTKNAAVNTTPTVTPEQTGSINADTPTITATPSPTITVLKTTVAPTKNETPVTPAPQTGIPIWVWAAVIIVVGIIGGYFLRRWWIRRQNPALFRDYD